MDSKGEAGEFPPTYIIIQFSKRIKKETANWLLNKIISSRKLGGAELDVRAQPFVRGERLTFHVSAGLTKLLELAEELELKKRDCYGVLREFTVRELSEFTHNVDKENLLTTAERQILTKHEVENIRALAVDGSVPGYPHLTLYEGQTIIPPCLKEGLVKQIFPLHDEDEIKKLSASWYMTMFSPQPFESIRQYFGESIALYFQFLDFYSWSLVLPMIFGFLQLLLYPEALPFFCIFNIIAASIFLELWRKKCTELAYVWGTIGMNSLDEPRPNFTGTMAPDPITGKLFPYYPRWKTTVKMYCVSMPAVMVCLLGAFCVMLLSFYVENILRQVPDTAQWVIALPSIVYAALISLMNAVYRKFASFLTEWENHRSQSQFDRHRVTKLVLFEFVNNFMSLFYVAFVIQDMDMLRSQLATLMIIYQVINNIQEAILPMLIQSYTPKVIELSDKVKKKDKRGREMSTWTMEDFPFIKALPSDHSAVIQAKSESQRGVYEDPYDDYLELFVQFGYVFLFSAIYPMAAFWAAANNFFEIRCDAFKLCCVYQRPLARRVKDTGAWQRSLQALCSVAVVTNCALLCLSPKLKAWASEDTTATQWVMYFVILEHCILALRQILHYAIPDKPEWVRIALAKGNYLSKQALKMQRMTVKKN